VLSTVQSSMSAGQDASQTLSRLMDWAEAREVSRVCQALAMILHRCQVQYRGERIVADS
jgi:hypothetical protein